MLTEGYPCKKTQNGIYFFAPPRRAASGHGCRFLSWELGCIRYKQYVRGLIYLLTQIGFFCFLKNFALQYLSKFFTLGAETQRKVWNEDLQIYQRFPGDNSMLILLYSVLSLAVIAVFLYIWYANIRDSWHAQENLREGRKIRELPGRPAQPDE